MENGQQRRRGRPPAFDRATALKAAAQTFWRLGYEGASIADLTASMGITAQSLYAAFGSKAGLYRDALQWYGVAFAAFTPDELEAPDVIATLGALLLSQARCFADPVHPPGCMVASALLGCAVENESVARMVAALREDNVARLRTRLERAKAEGELRPDSDPAALARFTGAIIQGMSVQARDGASQAELEALAAVASQALALHAA